MVVRVSGQTEIFHSQSFSPFWRMKAGRRKKRLKAKSAQKAEETVRRIIIWNEEKGVSAASNSLCIPVPGEGWSEKRKIKEKKLL